jgi:transcriptional regulator with XRE-family HTH domain
MEKKQILLPNMQTKLSLMGENIQLARLRRKFSIPTVAERAGISQMRVKEIEKGYSSLSLREYLLVLRVLGLEKDIYNIASDDPLGRKLQDIELLKSNEII